MADEELGESGDQENAKIIQPQKIYLKDASFESPNSPELFKANWNPKVSIEFNHTTAELEEDFHEVVLTLTATVTIKDKTAFLVEIHQAGIFVLKGHDEAERERVLSVYCLRTLYPYACAALSDLVIKGGFPGLPLGVMNFGALYKKRQQEKLEQEDS